VTKHKPILREQDEKLRELFDSSEQSCDWQTLYTHPKLMSKYFHKDRRIHSRDQRIQEIKSVLKIKDGLQD